MTFRKVIVALILLASLSAHAQITTSWSPGTSLNYSWGTSPSLLLALNGLAGQVGIGVVPSHFFHIQLPGSDNVYIDTSGSPRVMTEGVLRIDHLAGIPGTKALYLEINSASYGDTHAINIDWLSGAMAPMTESHTIEVNIDGTSSTGGSVKGLSVDIVALGSLTNVYAVEAQPGVAPILQNTGSAAPLSQGWYYNGSTYTDVTTASATIFSNNNDYLYVGSASVFTDINVILTSIASKSITPVFTYWNGSTWAAFGPSDATNGMRQSGNIVWSGASALTGWASTSVNGVAAYYVRIQRTRTGSITAPVLAANGLHTTNAIPYMWDSTGAVHVRALRVLPLSIYANNAAAITGGLVAGDFYRTGADPDMVAVVH